MGEIEVLHKGDVLTSASWRERDNGVAGRFSGRRACEAQDTAGFSEQLQAALAEVGINGDPV